MKINREHIKKTFQEYTDRYDSTNPKIKLKIDHTYRVANLCEQIAQSLELSAAEVDLAWLSGMLHDVGRFEQLRRYNTFSDAQSIDHARFAVELLYDDGLIADYVPEISTTELVADARTWRSMGGANESPTAQSEDIPLSDILQTLRIAIGEHSAYRIQKGLDERTRMFCQILRDADKVDIFRVICDTPMEEVYGFQTKDILRSAITPEVMQAFYEHHAVLRKLKKCPADYIVAHGSLTFELVYPESLRIAKEQGYLKQMMSFQSENPDTAEIFEDLRKDLNGYLEERS
ncbi:HD domain-containing protein [Roseburia sp. AM59-24XD]|jgi:putative nucleotidyltransferase with HDIG domain|uniref:HD domain-containing protein n=1 Tax=Roseburia sp. AM59-24XD TaxID=2293138 RepID=UPI000E50036E|nr:HD domain-containing protein [Roseburia sp. AM59-24XD]RHP87052.1 HD domain-containing protein [Roseburia sp. AM59-24XD]